MEKPTSIRWSEHNRMIFTWLKDSDTYSMLERAHRIIHEIVKTKGPLNRFELAHLCMLEIPTKQDVQRIITDYKTKAITEGLLLVQQPTEFLDENPVDFTGVSFSRKGGYCIIDEFGNEHGNWKTADEAIYAHKSERYSHIPQT